MFKKEKQPIEEIEDEIEEAEEEVEVPTPAPVAKKVAKEETRNKIMIVKELPTQVVRQIKDEDGTVIDLKTTEEFLTEMANQ